MAHSEQPPPHPERSDLPCVQDLVLDDIAARKQVGIARYGTPLQPFNGRDALRDAYEEALDGAFYIRQALFERDEIRRLAREALDTEDFPMRRRRLEALAQRLTEG